MRATGRTLQLVGLVLLPVGVLFAMEGGPHAMTAEITFGLAGLGVFLLGLQIQRRGS